MDADASVSELAARYRMSFAAVQKHVAVLERAGVVTKRRDGKHSESAAIPTPCVAQIACWSKLSTSGNRACPAIGPMRRP